MVGNREDQRSSNAEHTGSSDDQETTINRRTAIKTLGVATGAAVLPMTAARGSAAQSDYSLVEVAAGDTKTVQVSGGETFENVLFDITAEGAGAQIFADGTDWTIRNVGFRGKEPEGIEPLVLAERGLVQNVYIGDGSVAGDSTIGVYTENDVSEGPLEFENVHIGYFTNNAIYATPTLAVENEGPVVNIRASYFENNNISNVKLGSPFGDCTIEDTVMRVDGDVRAHPNGIGRRSVWAHSEQTADGEEIPTTTVLRNCDIQGMLKTDNNGRIELENTRHDGIRDTDGTSEGGIYGESAGSPDLTPPADVPMTAEEAASGDASGDGTDGSTSDADSDPVYDHVLAVLTDTSVQSMDYSLYVDGDVAKTTTDDGQKAESNDTIETLSDGRTVVRGVTGNGFADAFEYSGSIDGFEITNISSGDISGVSFEIDGQAVSTQAVVDGTVGESDDGSTDDGTDGSTDDGTDGSTDDGTDGSTDDGTDDGTDGSTDDGTDGSTDDGTDGSTDDGTDGSTDDGTDGSTDDGTDGSSGSGGILVID
ncbi:hypothetical protein, partial [Halorientalis halophila]|uniref:hypothetical protein n=1 Tax=Halorientalis halophila TaxID=3108499 RepID=UPI0030087E22